MNGTQIHPVTFPAAPFEGVYLVSDELDLAMHAEVDVLERTLCCRMPAGYREYVATLGEGDYCDVLRVYPPRRVLAERGQITAFASPVRLAEFTRMTPEQAGHLVRFADTSNGNLCAIHPGEPDRIICWPSDRGCRPVTAVDARQRRLEDLYWEAFDRDLHDPPRFRTFDSRRERGAFDVHADGLLPDRWVTDLYVRSVGGRAHVESELESYRVVDRVAFVYSASHPAAGADVRRFLAAHGVGR